MTTGWTVEDAVGRLTLYPKELRPSGLKIIGSFKAAFMGVYGLLGKRLCILNFIEFINFILFINQL